MSHCLYNAQWHDAQVDLSYILEVERPKVPEKPQKDRVAAFQKVATMYVNYIQIFRRLEECYDQIVHPQKRRLIRHILDGTMGRILEMKNEMFGLELLEYHYFDDILVDMKLTPRDVEIPIPHYFISECAKMLKERDKMLATIINKKRPPNLTAEGDHEPPMTREDAIRLIQTHERARQGRQRGYLSVKVRLEDAKKMRQAQLKSGLPMVDKDDVATLIQKVWRGFSQRKKMPSMRQEELVFLGMAPPKMPSSKHGPITLSRKTVEKRRLTQDHYEKEFQEALNTIKGKLIEMEGPDMQEQLQDQIRQWFIENRDATGKFPEFPSVMEGGSTAIFKKREEPKLDEEDEGGKGKKGKDKKKDKKKDKDSKKGKKGKKGKGDEGEVEGFVMLPSKFVPTIAEEVENYASIWQGRDETGNPLQKYDAELIKDQKRLELEGEIRLTVDELMREELKNLKMAVERDKGKGKRGKKKKAKKKKGKKGGKKKREKDLTPDRTIESLYEELAYEGIISRHPKVRLSEFQGECSFLGSSLRQTGVEPMPGLADVKRVITEHCILPLGSQVVHEKAPHIKSMMLVGPHGVGKRMLVHSICTETGANMFDLSPATIASATRYAGKAGLMMLLHMVFKVARAWQPSVVFIGNCEKTWLKKVPKTDKTEPKRVKKSLPKILKGMKPEDRVLILGVTDRPFEAELKGLCGIYQRILMVPRPDYASRVTLWRSMILHGKGHLTDALDLTSLAKITDGYTAGQINSVAVNVLSEYRIQQLHRKPLTAAEFIGPLSKLTPVFQEEEESYRTWFTKTPLGKKRATFLKGDDEDDGGKDKKAKGKAKRNK